MDAATVDRIARETLGGCEEVFFPPDIPPRKLRGASKIVLRAVGRDERLVALIDITLFGGGKECTAVLDRRFLYKDLVDSEPKAVDYGEFAATDVSVEGMTVHLGPRTFNMYDSEVAKRFAEFLRRVAGDRPAHRAPSATRTTARRKCDYCGRFMAADAERCRNCGARY